MHTYTMLLTAFPWPIPLPPMSQQMTNKKKAAWLIGIPLVIVGTAVFGKSVVSIANKNGFTASAATLEFLNFVTILATVMLVPCAIIAIFYYFKKDVTNETTALIASLPENQKPHPWRRYFARSIDSWILAMGVGLPLVFLAPVEFIDQTPDFAIAIVVGLIMIPYDAVCMSNWNRTLGKWILGVTVTNAAGAPLTFEQGIKRGGLVFLRGQGIGVPLATFFTNIHQYNVLMKTGMTSWDTEVGCRVTYTPLSVIRVLLVLLFAFVIIGLTVLSAIPL